MIKGVMNLLPKNAITVGIIAVLAFESVDNIAKINKKSITKNITTYNKIVTNFFIRIIFSYINIVVSVQKVKSLF